jgi:hypothetical protein
MAFLPDLVGDIFASKAKKKKAKSQRRLGLNFIGDARGILSQSNSQTESRLQSAVAEISKGFGAARTDASKIGRGQKQQILDNQRKQAANLTQSALQSGLSVDQDQMRQSLGRQTNQQLSQVNDRLASIFTELGLGEGQAKAEGERQLAGFEQDKAQQQFGLERALFDILSGTDTAGSKEALFSQGAFRASEAADQALELALKAFSGGLG